MKFTTSVIKASQNRCWFCGGRDTPSPSTGIHNEIFQDVAELGPRSDGSAGRCDQVRFLWALASPWCENCAWKGKYFCRTVEKFSCHYDTCVNGLRLIGFAGVGNIFICCTRFPYTRIHKAAWQTPDRKCVPWPIQAFDGLWLLRWLLLGCKPIIYTIPIVARNGAWTHSGLFR